MVPRKAKATTPEERARELARSMADSFKGGTIRIMASREVRGVPRIPTGLPGLDWVLDGGFAAGRIIEVFGPESSGKTSVALSSLANAQREGHLCGFIDAEHALDLSWVRRLGVNLDALLLMQPDYGEAVFEAIETWAQAGISFVVVDSVAAMIPKAELEGSYTDQHVGIAARMNSRGVAKVAGIVEAAGLTVIFVNQVRDKIGVMFGNPETTPGGRALKFYASQRLEIRRRGDLTSAGSSVGVTSRARLVKSKVGPPGRVREFPILYSEGPSRALDLTLLAVELGVFEKRAGGWLSHNGENLAQGAVSAAEALSADPETYKTVEAEVRSRLSETK